jgi:hypothetical protein
MSAPRDVLSLPAEAPTVTLSLKFLFDCMKIILLICAGVPRSDQAENDTAHKECHCERYAS